MRRGRVVPPSISRPPVGGGVKRLTSRTGQHMFEYALLIGMVTIAAVVMQLFARQGVQTGLKIISDVVLDPPPPPDPADNSQVSVEANSAVIETGDAAFNRQTMVAESITGTAVNEDTRTQVILQ